MIAGAAVATIDASRPERVAPRRMPKNTMMIRRLEIGTAAALSDEP
jgi:hypothetical protein